MVVESYEEVIILLESGDKVWVFDYVVEFDVFEVVFMFSGGGV